MEFFIVSIMWLTPYIDIVRATAERLSRDLAGDPKHI